MTANRPFQVLHLGLGVPRGNFAVAILLAAFLSVCGRSSVLAKEAKRPNVVLIMTDNHGAWTLGCYGNRDIRTPNIDRLANEGVLFTRAFASNPVCSPTRATCLTGLVPSQHGVHSFLAGGRLQVGPDARCTLSEFTSLPEVLRNNGYSCGLVGKWHLGGNLTPQEGLDEYWITMPHGGTSTFYDAQIIDQGKIRKEPTYLTDFWTSHAVKFIEEQAKQEDPFFLFLAYNGPYALSRLLLREGRNRHAEYYADQPLDSFPRGDVHPWQLNNRDFINNPVSIRRVATEVSGVDDGVGDVMRALERSGVDENTIVVFVADQGWVGGHGGFFGMGDHTRPLTARDGMMQIPLIWRHPEGISKGVRVDRLVANYDLMPTLLGHLDLGDQMPVWPKSPGVDHSQLLVPNPDTSKPSRPSREQDADASEDAIFYEFENLRCIRTESHKYIHRHPNGPHELYDLESDPTEFVNLIAAPDWQPIKDKLKGRLDSFYDEYSLPKYDMWNGGTSQVRIHDGIDEELAQHIGVEPPPIPAGFKPAPINVPEGFSVDLAAGPPLVTHPTMACLDDRGRLYVCNNAGVNMTNAELEEHLPNSIRRLVDTDGDGNFDSFTVFADRMTFPMGGAFHNGSLFVASPPHIWKLTDTDDDGVADQRVPIVSEFGYNGNAASIHGCFFGPDGRLYWTDGYHGHEFKDTSGKVTSQREGSYIFSCLPDGSDKRIHCGGGMDNPVEIDFTSSGDMLGTVNILYTRPRVDCFVHWLHGGVYPHRERVLKEVHVTGDMLGPAHKFGHVAVSGMTRYRSGVLDHRWSDDHFVTFFNSGKVVRLELNPEGSSYTATQHEFLSSPSREFHPTDVLEDSDGSLLVIDTGGWFYRGCPTSQFAKPELLGGIYRIRRDGMTTLPNPLGTDIDWSSESPASLVKRMNDTRHQVREQAIQSCAERGQETLPILSVQVVRGDIRIRENAVLAITRLLSDPNLGDAVASALLPALRDTQPHIQQTACRGLGFVRNPSDVIVEAVQALQNSDSPSVRRQAHTTLGLLGDPRAINGLIESLGNPSLDRSEEHAAVYALISISDANAVRSSASKLASMSVTQRDGVLLALAQTDEDGLSLSETMQALFESEDSMLQRIAFAKLPERADWTPRIIQRLRHELFAAETSQTDHGNLVDLLAELIDRDEVSDLTGEMLGSDKPELRFIALRAIAKSKRPEAPASWQTVLTKHIRSTDRELAKAAIAACAPYRQSSLRDPLQRLSRDRNVPVELRMDALSVLHSGTVETPVLEELIQLYRDAASPTASDRAAHIIGAAQLSGEQLLLVAPLLASASPAQLRDLIRPFQRGAGEDQAIAFLDNLERAASLDSLAEAEVSDIVKRFPRPMLKRGNTLLDRLKEVHQARVARLHRLRDQLGQGDAARGKLVFQSDRAKCASCHRIGQTGKAVGPDLSSIGGNRSATDLLESIIFPSASIVRDYGTHQLLTSDGRALQGMVVSESNSTLVLQQASGEQIQIDLKDIETIQPSNVSIMPTGLDGVLKESELLDVVRYLQTLN